MQTKFKFKFSTMIIVMLMGCLSGCDKGVSNYIAQGYKIPVIYDLGEGVNNRDAHSLTVYYQPSSYIFDLSTDNRYEFTHDDGENCTYELEGWYFDKNFTEKVDFTSYILPNNTNSPITIYANWVAIYDKFFDIYFVDIEGNVQSWTDDKGNKVEFKSVRWEIDKPFTYSKKTMEYPTSETYTYIEAYKDKEMTTLVDSSYIFTKENEELTNLPVYLKWIKGEYEIITTASQLKSKFGYFNLYINADVDMKNTSLNHVPELKDKTILGNNHTISNLVCSSASLAASISGNAIGGGLADVFKNVVMKDLTFDNVTYKIEAGRCSGLYYAPLAGNIVSSTIKNISITGTIQYEQSIIDKLNKNEVTLRLTTEKASYQVDVVGSNDEPIENPSTIECSININNPREEQ